MSYLLLLSYFGFIDANIDAKMKEKRTELRKRVQITVLQRTTRYVSNQCMVGAVLMWRLSHHKVESFSRNKT